MSATRVLTARRPSLRRRLACLLPPPLAALPLGRGLGLAIGVAATSGGVVVLGADGRGHPGEVGGHIILADGKDFVRWFGYDLLFCSVWEE